MNVDTLKTNDAIESITYHLRQNKIDISCIQETHNGNIDFVSRSGFGIYFSGLGGI